MIDFFLNPLGLLIITIAMVGFSVFMGFKEARDEDNARMRKPYDFR